MPNRDSTKLPRPSRYALLVALFIAFAGACGSGSDADNSQSPLQKSNATVKIMPLGDSITQSSTGLNSYRYYLWHLLLNHGYHVDFVGAGGLIDVYQSVNPIVP